MDWIDNADSYICPVCRYEISNPLVNNACCPKCGFVPDRFKAPAQPEYIERQKTIDAIRSRCAPCGEGIEAVVSVAAADVVQVTRCRNCRYGDWDSEPDDAMVCTRTHDGFWRSGNDFCSSGEPRRIEA